LVWVCLFLWVFVLVGLGGFGVADEFGVWGHPACGPRVSPWVVVLRGRLGRQTLSPQQCHTGSGAQ
jgi:hypothetical protein